VTWTVSIPNPMRVASQPYVLGAIVVDGAKQVQQATLAGTTGPNAVVFNDSGGSVVDGLQWTDYGLSVWAMNTKYFTLGTLISEQKSPYHVQKVYEEGTSGASMPAFNHSGGLTPDNAVVWAESHPLWAAGTYTVGNAGTLILDSNNNVEVVTNNNLSNKVNSVSGTSGPTQPSWNTTTGANPITGVAGTTVDGLVWTNQVSVPDSSVIARYPVAGVTTLESAALDPLVSNCLNNVCTTTASPSPYPVPTIDNLYLNTNFSLPAAGFWLGDSASPTFYRMDFATGTYSNSTYDASQSCSTCTAVKGIESLALYGSEGSNQPHLAELFTGNLTTALNSQTVQFLGNIMTASVYTSSGSSTIGTIPLTVYGSPVNPASNFTDSPAIPNGLPCTATYPSTSPTTCLVWKVDLFTLAPISGDYLSLKLAGPSSITTNTYLFTDAAINTTVLVGNFDPGDRSSGSAHGPYQTNPTYSEAQSGCFFETPVLECYSNPSSYPLPFLEFAFKCPKALPGTSLDKLTPTFTIAELYPNISTIQAATYPTVKGLNNTTNYAYNSKFEDFEFYWIPPATPTTQYYTSCTFDTAQNLVQSFCQNFILSPNCLANPWINSISPTSGPEGTTVTITGAFFESGATVTFGGAAASHPTIHATSITAVVPSTTPLGSVNVTVTNPNGLNYTLVSGFDNTSP